MRLATELYLPDVEGPVPAVLQRLPYDKEPPILLNLSLDVMRTVRAGYAVVTQDTRGRFASEGEFNPRELDGLAGYYDDWLDQPSYDDF